MSQTRHGVGRGEGADLPSQRGQSKLKEGRDGVKVVAGVIGASRPGAGLGKRGSGEVSLDSLRVGLRGGAS